MIDFYLWAAAVVSGLGVFMLIVCGLNLHMDKKNGVEPPEFGITLTRYSAFFAVAGLLWPLCALAVPYYLAVFLYRGVRTALRGNNDF